MAVIMALVVVVIVLMALVVVALVVMTFVVVTLVIVTLVIVSLMIMSFMVVLLMVVTFMIVSLVFVPLMVMVAYMFLALYILLRFQIAVIGVFMIQVAVLLPSIMAIRVTVIMVVPRQQPMRVLITPMKYIIKYYIDEHPSNGGDEHDGGPLHKLLIDDPLSGSIDNEDDHEPDDEDIGQCAYQLHAMIAE